MPVSVKANLSLNFKVLLCGKGVEMKEKVVPESSE